MSATKDEWASISPRANNSPRHDFHVHVFNSTPPSGIGICGLHDLGINVVAPYRPEVIITLPPLYSMYRVGCSRRYHLYLCRSSEPEMVGSVTGGGESKRCYCCEIEIAQASTYSVEAEAAARENIAERAAYIDELNVSDANQEAQQKEAKEAGSENESRVTKLLAWRRSMTDQIFSQIYRSLRNLDTALSKRQERETKSNLRGPKGRREMFIEREKALHSVLGMTADTHPLLDEKMDASRTSLAL
ncbi:hypothetical protein MMC25_006735 [Agyrium rufum]|nr:hypothetical protein [Agyrium rufum]